MAAASTLCGGLVAKSADALDGTVLALCTATALALQVFSDFANDYGDTRHGADSPLRQGPVRMVASGRISQSRMRAGLVLAALFCCALGIALLAAALPAVAATEPAVWLLWLLLGAAAIAAAFGYTAGRKPYGYHGWGDFSVLLFFGWLGVLGSAWLQSGQLHPSALLPATALGLWCSMVLNLTICATSAAIWPPASAPSPRGSAFRRPSATTPRFWLCLCCCGGCGCRWLLMKPRKAA